MKHVARVLGPILCVVALAACAAETSPPPAAQHAGQCTRPGDACRWDKQCCSGRCYVDTGCSG